MSQPTWTEHQTIWLEPMCEKRGCGEYRDPTYVEGRCWCAEPQDPCEECGKPWVKFTLAEDQPIPERADDGEGEV